MHRSVWLIVGLLAACVAWADTQEFGWTAEGFIDPNSGESGRAQVALYRGLRRVKALRPLLLRVAPEWDVRLAKEG